MLATIYFIILVAIVIVAGAFFSYPLFLILHPFTEIEFHKFIGNVTILCGLLFCFAYLKINNISIKEGFGYALPRKKFIRQMLNGCGAGILIMLGIVLMLILLGVYGKENELNPSISNLISITVLAVFTGCLVGLIEESIFRGALFSGLYKKTNATITVITTSLVYAAVHFLKYRKLDNGIVINWATGLEMIPDALFRFGDPVIIDSFLTLFMLGVLLSLIRLRNNNIALAAGVHAGIVMVIKLTGEFTDYVTNNPYPFLVNKYDHMLGSLALGWLVLLCVIYIFWNKRKPLN